VSLTAVDRLAALEGQFSEVERLTKALRKHVMAVTEIVIPDDEYCRDPGLLVRLDAMRQLCCDLDRVVRAADLHQSLLGLLKHWPPCSTLRID
jgi:hypothetical protein